MSIIRKFTIHPCVVIALKLLQNRFCSIYGNICSDFNILGDWGSLAIVPEENFCLFVLLVKLHLIPSVAPICKSFWSLLAIFCLFLVLAMSFYCHSLVLVLVRALPKTSARQRPLQDMNPHDTLLVNPGLLATFLNLFYMHQMKTTTCIFFMYVLKHLPPEQ